jgi:hypothetical protein
MIEEREMRRELKKEKEQKKRRCGWVCHIQPCQKGDYAEMNLNAIVLGAQHQGADSTDQQIMAILNEFEDLFKEPRGQPPTRSHDHEVR